MSNGSMTRDWELYESGKKYNSRLSPSYYETVNTNLSFFAGDQWRGSETTQLMKPVFNIIKRVTTFFVASLTSSRVSTQFKPLALNGDADTAKTGAEVATAEIENIQEKHNMDNRVRDALFQAAIKGDVAGHWYWDPNKKPFRGKMGEGIEGEICFELVSGTNIMFGNANNPDKEVQPYIILSGRDMVSNLQEEAEMYRKKDAAEQQITEDSEYNNESGEGGKIEVEADGYGKALYIIKYFRDKKTKTIHASKCVQNAYIYEDIDTGLEYYPISWLIWEKQENQYHGRALITGVIPNQIFINKMFAMVMYHLMMTAFPKAIYNKDYIAGWDNGIGSAIGISGVDQGMNIKNLAGFLEPGQMSNQITQVIDMAMAMTKETLGISDASLGNVAPTNTSAIIAVQKSSSIPLENPKANLHEWMEDNAKIELDMMGTYYGIRPIVRDVEAVDPMTGQKQTDKQIEMYDFSQFKDMWLQTKVDVGEASYWSEVASIQTLDNLLTNGMIDIVDYLERIPNGYIPQRQELINKINERVQAQQQVMAQEEEQAAVDQEQNAQFEQIETFIKSLPPEIQQQLEQIRARNPDQYEEAVMQLMEQHAA